MCVLQWSAPAGVGHLEPGVRGPGDGVRRQPLVPQRDQGRRCFQAWLPGSPARAVAFSSSTCAWGCGGKLSGANPVAKLSRVSGACKKCEQIVADIHTCKLPDPNTGHTRFRLSFALTHSWHSVCPFPFCQDSAQCTTLGPSLCVHSSLNYGDLLPGNLHSFHHESFLIF